MTSSLVILHLSKMFLSWIIPCYNEESRIEKTIKEVDVYLRSQQFPEGYEIVVVNSASTDRTAEIVEGLKRDVPVLRLFNLENKGKGWAVKEGMRFAGGEVRLFADADNSVSVEHLALFLPLLCREEGESGSCYDVVIGSIAAEGASVEEHAQWYRRMLGKWSKYLIRFVAGLWEIRDTQRGFKVFSRRAAAIIFPRQTIMGWGFDIEVLLIAKRHGLRIKEVPVRWVNPAGSKVGLGAYLSTLRELCVIKWNELRGRYK